MKTAVVAGSFNPMHNGHIWLIQQALQLADHVVVAIGQNVAKQPVDLRRVKARVKDILFEVLFDRDKLKRLSVHSYTGLLRTFIESQGGTVLIRSIRSASDLDQELAMAEFHHGPDQEIQARFQTVYLSPPAALRHVSSSFIKALLPYPGWEKRIGPYVPSPTIEFIAMDQRAKKDSHESA